MSKNPTQWAEQSRQYLTEVQVEFKKVTWPTRQETVAGTISVLAVVAVLAVALFGVDSILSFGIGWLLG